uniref:Uncharacterized protein n=1 Tax=Lepeophtheirus salmonis TaxID=72036 RepID=A0A0K2TIW7_LEPSM
MYLFILGLVEQHTKKSSALQKPSGCPGFRSEIREKLGDTTT